jgi:hypothetical protein
VQYLVVVVVTVVEVFDEHMSLESSDWKILILRFLILLLFTSIWTLLHTIKSGFIMRRSAIILSMSGEDLELAVVVLLLHHQHGLAQCIRQK